MTAAPTTCRPVLLVCSGGGHLTQLVALRPWWTARPRTWVTADTPHTRSLLQGEQIVWGHFPTTRNAVNLIRNAFLALRMLLPRSSRPEAIISTGAGLAVPFFVFGRLLRIPTVYIEVFDRVDSRTLTGRLCRPFSSLFLVQLPEQQPLYRDALVVGSLLGTGPDATGDDAGAPDPGAWKAMAGDSAAPGSDLPVLLVTIGTNKHPFTRIIGWVDRWLASGGQEHVQLVLQHGATPVEPGPGRFSELGHDALQAALSSAAIVVTHGGPATIMEARAAGHLPVAVPRRPDLSEQVDGHQLRFAVKLRADGLAVVCETESEFRAALDRAVTALQAGGGRPAVWRALADGTAAAGAAELGSETFPDGTSRAAELIDALLISASSSGLIATSAMSGGPAPSTEGHADD
jgi:UDP-N-acetylglucosamine transferase subunit ALG13